MNKNPRTKYYDRCRKCKFLQLQDIGKPFPVYHCTEYDSNCYGVISLLMEERTETCSMFRGPVPEIIKQWGKKLENE